MGFWQRDFIFFLQWVASAERPATIVVCAFIEITRKEVLVLLFVEENAILRVWGQLKLITELLLHILTNCLTQSFMVP